MSLGRVVVVIPTYNEASNLEWIVGRLRAAQPVNPLIASNRKHPCRGTRFTWIEIRRLLPYRDHDLLGHFLGDGIRKT